MELFRADELGIDLLSEMSVGRYVTDLLDSSGYYVAYRPDGTTPVNVINSFAWIDDLERKEVVKRKDYTNYKHQLPLPIISFDFLNHVAESIEMGSNTKKINYSLAFVISAENKAQLVNLGGFIQTFLEEKEVPLLNYNVANYPQIGVIHFEDTISTRMFDVFAETNLAKNYSISVTCDAIAEYNNSFER